MSGRKKSPKIVISGYYGFNNCGDEAVLLAIVHCLKKLKSDVRIIVLSNNPAKTRAAYGVNAVYRWNPVGIVLSILTCRLVISGGGSLIQDVTSSRSVKYYLAVIGIAHFLNKKVMIYSQGVGPLTIEKNRVRTLKAFERCQLITVRDNRSADFLREIGLKSDIKVTSDPVMAFHREDIGTADIEELLREAGVPERIGVKSNPLLLVAVRSWKDDTHIAPIAEFLDHQSLNGWDVLFIPAFFPDDMGAVTKIIDIMTSKSYCLDRSLTARQFIAMTARADMVFSMRLHGLICAMAMDTPMLGLSYDPKVDGFMEQAGLEKYCLSYDSFSLETANSLLEELNKTPPDLIQERRSRCAEMQESAWEPARKAIELAASTVSGNSLK